MKYMIHSCNNRKWYVDEYLVPSMLKQGIKEEDIYVYNDDKCEGNLVSWVVSCHVAYELWGETNVWHLQDDVLICSKFKERTEELENNPVNIVCGFTTHYDDGRNPGEKPAYNHMWYSFPCIRIHSRITKLFAEWADLYVWRDPQYGFYIRNKKGDDFIFRVYIESYFPNEPVLNLTPNLVEHIDWVIGGTTVNKNRAKQGKAIRSIYWLKEDEYLVEALEKKLMKYIIMCGGNYQMWETPKQLLKVNDECIVERTIRLLREAGVKNIAISSNNKEFEKFGVPLLRHNNSYDVKGYNDFTGYWCDAFYPTDYPVCYIFGDVVFSKEAIQKIVDTDTDSIEFFASAPPFAKNYYKEWAEPFALKVVDYAYLAKCIDEVKRGQNRGDFRRKPIMWELWQVIKKTPLNIIDYTNYTKINDWTCDIDEPREVERFEKIIKEIEK